MTRLDVSTIKDELLKSTYTNIGEVLLIVPDLHLKQLEPIAGMTLGPGCYRLYNGVFEPNYIGKQKGMFEIPENTSLLVLSRDQLVELYGDLYEEMFALSAMTN